MRHDGPVLIALDGSPHSTQTLDWGLTEAALQRAPVVLARCYQEPREYAEWSWYPVHGDLEAHTEAKQYLADALETANAARPDLAVTTTLLHGGEVPQLRAVSESARLLVVGARGEDGRPGVGRVAAHLAAHARCSVAVVRDVVETTRVVVGVDGSPASLEAAETAARAAQLRGVPVMVLHARPPVMSPYGRYRTTLPPIEGADDSDPTRRAAERTAAELRERHAGLEVVLRLVDDDPTHALVASGHDGALLVVGSRGLGAFRGMLLGAVSNEVVANALATVIVVHGSDRAGGS